jgi:hypothetical protein
MNEDQQKPLYWSPAVGVGYTVARRQDGGMNLIFTDTSSHTLSHWREFALSHLLDSDRLTRNLYDLRQIDYLPPEAVEYAVEVNNDPSVRNIRLAVVVANDQVRSAVEEISALTTPGGVEMGVFDSIDEAETWLDRPLTLVV